MTWIALLAGLAASILLCGWTLTTFAFAGESARGGPNELQNIFGTLALVSGFAPLLLSVVLLVWRGGFADSFDRVPLGGWLPLIAAALGFALMMGCTVGGGMYTAGRQEAAEQATIAAAKADYRADPSTACRYINLDPHADAGAVAACFAQLHVTADPAARLLAMQPFLSSSRMGPTGFTDWNISQLRGGDWDFNSPHIPVVPPAEQPWFIEAFFTAWMAAGHPNGDEDMEALTSYLGSLDHDWGVSAQDAFIATVEPALRDALAKLRANGTLDERGTSLLDNISDTIDRIRRHASQPAHQPLSKE